MRILIITRSPWDDTNSTGNTMTNIWGGWKSCDISNVYCRSSKPRNRVCKMYYSISEKSLLNSLIYHKYEPGYCFTCNSVNEKGNDTRNINFEERLYGFFRKNAFVLAQWARELLWLLGRWKNDRLKQFLISFKPDIIFMPCFAAWYTHRLLWHIKELTCAKVVLFHVDDYLTDKGFCLSPLLWINRKITSQMVEASARKADLNYCISPKQQEEYSYILKREMKLLYKGADFNRQQFFRKISRNDRRLIRMVYIGTTLYGRWKTLGILAHSIQKINADKPVFELMIYSQYQPSQKAMQTMVINGASYFMGKVPADKVAQVLNDADIVLHVESFDKKERVDTRLSFSTKIVDCLNSGRCILAIGWDEAASIDYLKENDAAIIATDEENIIAQLKNIINDPGIITKYAEKAWICGNHNHQIDVIRSSLYKDLENIYRVNKNESLTN